MWNGHRETGRCCAPAMLTSCYKMNKWLTSCRNPADEQWLCIVWWGVFDNWMPSFLSDGFNNGSPLSVLWQRFAIITGSGMKRSSVVTTPRFKGTRHGYFGDVSFEIFTSCGVLGTAGIQQQYKTKIIKTSVVRKIYPSERFVSCGDVWWRKWMENGGRREPEGGGFVFT